MQEDHHLQADALARLQVRLGRPGQERGDVARELVDVGVRVVGAVGVVMRPSVNGGGIARKWPGKYLL